MTRKDYIAIGEAVGRAMKPQRKYLDGWPLRDEETLQRDVMNALSDVFKSDNSRFCRHRFETFFLEQIESKKGDS